MKCLADKVWSIGLTVIIIMLLFNSISSRVFASSIKNVETEKELIETVKSSQNGDIIKLLKNIETNQTLNFTIWGGTVTLDLNGYDLRIVSPDDNAVKMTGWKNTLVLTDSRKSGTLTAICSFTGTSKSNTKDSAAIRVLNTDQTLVIDGAKVIAEGGSYGSGIGGELESTGNIIIKEGDITATGGLYGAGIGGGFNKLAGNITIESGIVQAKGGEGGAGIGTGAFEKLIYNKNKNANQILIKGGSINSTGGEHAAGIGGGILQTISNLIIDNGKIVSQGGNSAAGIGTGKLSIAENEEEQTLSDSEIIINGGNIKATGGDYGAGIGTGEGKTDYSTENIIKNRAIRINGGNILSKGGDNGAGIGGGGFLSGGIIEINESNDKNTVLDAVGGNYAAGIGGGKAGVAGADIKINSGKLNITGGTNAAGIGSGEFSAISVESTDLNIQNLKNVSILGGEIKVTGGANAAAIGGGLNGSGVNLTINGEPKVEAISQFYTTIGAGKNSHSQGSFIIDGGNVKTNKSVGVKPKNSKDENVYPGVITLMAQDNTTPISDGKVVAMINEGYDYTAKVFNDGQAHIYLPDIETPINTKVITIYKDIYTLVSFDKEKNTDKKIIVGFNPLEVKEKERVYYIDSYPNSYLPYKENFSGTYTFEMSNNEANISVNEKTGEVIIPPEIVAGTYNFTITAFNEKNKELLEANRSDFTLHVKENLESLATENENIVLGINESKNISLYPVPNNSEINHTVFKLTSGNEENCKIINIGDNSQKMNYEFSASQQGEYTLTFTAKDKGGNQAVKNVKINVLDESISAWSQADSEFTQDNKIYDPVPPTISSWNVDRINEASAEIIFDSNKESNHLYKIAPVGESPLEDYSQGAIIKEGKNIININNLEKTSAYTYYIKSSKEDGNTEYDLEILIPAYNPPDIMPPVITNGYGERTEFEDAVITFNSDEDGDCLYAFKYDRENTEVPHYDDYIDASKQIKAGENTLTFTGLLNSDAVNFYVRVKDKENNISDPIKINIKPFSEKEDTLPKISAGWSKRESQESAIIGFNCDKKGEVFYNIVFKNGPEPIINTFESGKETEAGSNEINIENLPEKTAYDIYIKVKDSTTNRISDSYKISVEEFILNETKPLTIKAKEAVRTGPNSAIVTFMSNQDGVYYYEIAEEKGTPSKINLNLSGYAMLDGENKITVTNLIGAKSYNISIKGKNDKGETSQEILINIPKDDESPQLSFGYTHRATLNNAQIEFEADKPGKYYYSIVEKDGKEPSIFMTEKNAVIGNNKFTIDNLFTSGGVDVYIFMIDEVGNKSNRLKLEVKSFENITRDYKDSLILEDPNKIILGRP